MNKSIKSINNLKLIRSKKSLELYAAIQRNTFLLKQEINAIIIQKYIRRYLSKLIIKKKRKVLLYYNLASNIILNQLIDEISIFHSLVITRNCLKYNEIKTKQNQIIINIIVNYINRLLNNDINYHIRQIVKLSVNEIIQSYLANKPKKPIVKPVVREVHNEIINEEIIDSLLISECKVIVKKAIREMTDEYLQSNHSLFVLNVLLDEIIFKFLTDINKDL